MTKLLIIYAPTKEDINKIIDLLPRTLNSQYIVLVLKPRVDVRGLDEFVSMMKENVETLKKQTTKRVGNYVG